MTLRQKWHWLLVAITLLFPVAKIAAKPAPSPLDIGDLLALEDTGRALIDPSGTTAVVERMPRYDKLPDYGVDYLYAYWSGAHLAEVDLRGLRPLTPLFAEPPGSQSRLISFSPQGRYLAFYRVLKGSTSIGIFDRTTRAVRILSGTPLVDFFGLYSPVWTDETHLAFVRLNDGAQPWPIGGRRANGERLYEAWQRSWRGTEPSASILQTAAAGGNPPRAASLVLADIAAGHVRTIAHGSFNDLRVSSDGRYLSALEAVRLQPQDPSRLNQEWVIGQGRIRIFGVRDQTEHSLSRDELSFPGTAEWSTDGRLAAFVWPRDSTSEHGFFRIYDPSLGSSSKWPHSGLDLISERERGLFQRPERFAWLGNALAVVARPSASTTQSSFTHRDMNLGAQAAPNQASPEWFQISANGPVKSLTAGLKGVSPVLLANGRGRIFVLADGSAWQISEAGRQRVGGLPSNLEIASVEDFSRQPRSSFLLSSAGGSSTRLFVVDGSAGGKVVGKGLRPTSSKARILATSARSGAALLRLDATRRSDLLRVTPQRVTTVESFNQISGRIATPTWRKISYTYRGETLRSCALLPPGFDPNHRAALVLDIYPSREAIDCSENAGKYGLLATPSFDTVYTRLLAASGKVVLFASNPAKFDRTDQGPLVGLAPVILAGIKAAQDQLGTDPARVGVVGMSQGGFAALWLASELPSISCTMASHSWANMSTQYLESTFLRAFDAGDAPMGNFLRYEAMSGSEYGLGKTLWEDRDAFLRNSPLYRTDRIKSPTLLIASDMDSFDMREMEAMYAALDRHGAKAKLIRFWGEGHGASSPANLRMGWREISDWFDNVCWPRPR
jgi:dipeptidyl aminopeptidase/acylaminoacyl peptidase